MHICVFSDGYPPWERGGAQKVAAQLAEGYRRRGHEVSVITTVADRAETGRTLMTGIDVHRLFTPQWDALLPYLSIHNPFVVGPCARLLDRLDLDVVHAHNVHWLSKASLNRAADQVPVVKTFHDAGTVSYGELTGFVEGDRPSGAEPIPAETYRVSPWRQLREQKLRYFPLRNRLNRRYLDRHVDVGVAVSHELRRALEANGIPCHATIHNGIDTERATRMDGDEAAFRRAHGLGDARIVLFGGRTGYNKGGAHLAGAFARLAAEVEDVALVVTGDDDYAERMREIAAPYGDRIVTTGWLSRATLDAAFRAATVVATPSIHLDPFPTVNLEAFARATPVVTTRFGGATELVTHGENGFVVDPFEIGALADALRTLIENPAVAAAYGTAGWETVERNFTLEGTIDAYADLVESVTTTRG